MQEPRSTSTLELVVNEQQMQNMSQIDLTRSSPNSPQPSNEQTGKQFAFRQLSEWPSRLRENFAAKIDEARSKSDTTCQFLFEVFRAFSGITIWILCFVCTIILPVCLFLIGLLNLDNCPGRPALPYLVFSAGFIMTASNLFNLALSLNLPVLVNQQILSNDIKNTIASIVNIIFNCTVAILYTICAYMVYNFNAYKQNMDGTTVTDNALEDIDCGSLLYQFTFWFITLTLGQLVVLGLIAAIFFAYNRYRLAIIHGSTPRSQTNSNQPNTPSANGVQLRL